VATLKIHGKELNGIISNKVDTINPLSANVEYTPHDDADVTFVQVN